MKVLNCFGLPISDFGLPKRYRTPSCFKYRWVQVFFGPRASNGLRMVFSAVEWGQDPITLSFPLASGGC